MKSKEKLLLFLEKKNEVVERRTGLVHINYISFKDLEEIKNWKVQECVKIYNEIVAAVKKSNIGKTILYDVATCPWCLKYQEDFRTANNANCKNCNYGKRHGICSDIPSDYKTITREKGFQNSKYDYLKIIREIEKLERRRRNDKS